MRKKWRKEKGGEYIKKREREDSIFKLKRRVRGRIYNFLKSKKIKKNQSTLMMLGCEWPFFKLYLESLFQPGMSWENYGEWHMDHISPLSRGKSEEQILKLCHYTNLRPLWAADNLLKSNKTFGVFIISKIKKNILNNKDIQTCV